MLRSVKSLEGFAIGATDGTFGKLKDFYFDDQAWVIRYLVVDTSSWLGGREVLISPYSISQPDWTGNLLPAKITKEQIKNSPSIESNEPVSRQYEKRYLGYYGYPYYWGGSSLWGPNYYPHTNWYSEDHLNHGYLGYLSTPSDDELGDPHLRSCNAVKGYHIHATDGEIGHVRGYLVDDLTWSIRYLIVNTSNWWVGHSVLISPEWIEQVSWAESSVKVSIDRQALKAAPAYDQAAIFDRNAESAIYNHYRRDKYWLTEPNALHSREQHETHA
jgi:hypothetical protein